MQFNKPAIDIQAQIELLKQRGLLFKDEIKAAYCLSNISYYRLRAYIYPFQDNTNPYHSFVKRIYFEDIIDIYVFDRKLRLLVFNAIEKIEISLRTKIIYHYSLSHGSHWHEDPKLYINSSRFAKDLNLLYDEISRSTETFIKHYKLNYSNPKCPPAWMSLEVVSMGLLSKLFNNLKLTNEKKIVMQSFGLRSAEVLDSWLHSICSVRNVCAHHGRLWNRRLTAIPTMPKSPIYPFLTNTNKLNTNKLYATLSCITYILNIISPQNTFNYHLKQLINNSSSLVNLKEMGFPNNWEKEESWQ